jgi:hypothetical protein
MEPGISTVGWRQVVSVMYVGKAGIVRRGALTCATRCAKDSSRGVEVEVEMVAAMMTTMNGWLLNLNV